MGRAYRYFSDRAFSSYHIISRTSRGEFLIDDEGKEYFMRLMFKLSKAFYVDITSFVIMSNHFHILLSNRLDEAKVASKEELIKRYKEGFGKKAEHPEGSYLRDTFEINYDEDGGIKRLRYRLGSVSRFIQELKQGFTKWYNYKHKCKGSFWSDRFKSIAIDKGEAELICSAYIDLNTIRAKMVKKPEDYRWSSIGLRVRNPKKAKKLLSDIYIEKRIEIIRKEPNTGMVAKTESTYETEKMTFLQYRAFVYNSGKVKKKGAKQISEEEFNRSKSLINRLGIGNSIRYRCRNITEGIAFGSYKFIEDIQVKFKRKVIKPRKVLTNDNKEDVLYSTRRLKPI